MTSTTPTGEIDPVSLDDLAALAAVATRPCVSVYLPTHRSGPETLQDPKVLRNCLDRAAELGATEDLLAPLRALIDDPTFWQHQADGLALFSAPGIFRSHRLPIEVDESVTVSDTFRVRPLVPLVQTGDEFRILALSQNHLRLFDADRYRIEELDLDGVPTSLSEALAYEDRDLRVHRTAGLEGQFHGHGAAEELDKAEVERYFRAVDHALHERFGVTGVPLVLASVGYYQPIYTSVSTAHTQVLEDVVEGNPERRSPAELHAEAWPIVERLRSVNGTSPWRRFQDASGTGLTASDLSTVALSAAVGRVDTLFVAPGPPVLGQIDVDTSTVRLAGDAGATEMRTDLVDRSVLDTVSHGGAVQAVAAEDLPDGSHVAALLRY